MKPSSIRFAFVAAALLASAPADAQDLYKLKINEVQSSSGLGDYVELYNAGEVPIELVPMVLKDRSTGEANEQPFCLGRIEPHGFWVANCPFLLNRHGEEVVLCDAGGTCYDRVAFPPNPTDSDNLSYVRSPDGGDHFCFQDQTQGQSNAAEPCRVAVVNARFSPLNPQVGEPVNITAWVLGAPAGTQVEVRYGPAATPLTSSVPAFDDGLHGDGDPGDGRYGAQVPSPPAEGIVQCQLTLAGAEMVIVPSYLFIHFGYQPPPLRINEVLAMNRRTGTWIPGSAGPFPDYIELFNAGTARVNVSQFLLRESFDEQGGYPITSLNGANPQWIEPQGHLLVWASPEAFGLAPVGVALSLSQNGEDLLLIAPDGVSVVDHVRFPALGRDEAYARVPEGTGPFQVLDIPTPEGGPIYPPGISAFIGTTTPTPLPDESIHLRLWVSTEVEFVSGKTIYKLEDIQGEVPLFNDGLHDDDLEGDQILGCFIPPLHRTGDLQFAFELVTSGNTYRNPAVPDEWLRIPLGLKPLGRLVLNEILSTRFDEGGICPDVWVPGEVTSSEPSKFVEIFNNGLTSEDFHFTITGSMFHWSTGLEFKRGHIASTGTVKAFPWEGLDAMGGTLFLRGVETGTLYDAVTYPELLPGQSYGRSPDGGPWKVLETPTPGELNGPFPFVRGDANGDGDLDISDAVKCLMVLFAGEKCDCRDSLDADDSGALDITDPVFLLGYLFLEGPNPPQPFPAAGMDVSADDLGCKRTAS